MTSQRKVRVAFSLAVDVNASLRSTIEKGHLSDFITKALQTALEERIALKEAYAAANQERALEDWSILDFQERND